ncbi:MDR family MFS transporter [Adlercreutzia sp. R21]|uniref:MDR family MFS transporter n=1 Tax=Adlercreutzia wanghongyangiae TaxID=3111451 RepID=UPI002DB82ECB|nr:MDR family MFS transporter [Adlercreutzia sp. R21]MEC4184297.1 MDR family MFS transporter [Adlercreutzia sp. R21]
MKLTRKQWMMLTVLVFGAFVTVLNQTLVTPALPSIMEEMSVDQSTAQWLTTGFTLVNAIMIPITAFLQDRFSTRRLFVFSMGMFALGTLLAAVGLNFPVLLGGRLVQAAGAGILMPVTMTVLMLVFPVDRRGSAMGIFGLVIAFAPAIGPTVAGFVIDQADWHILFYIIFGLSLVIIAASLFLVDDKAPANKGDSVLDPLSLVLSTLGFGLMLYGFSALGSAGLTLVPLLTTAVGIVGVVWFFVRQTRLPHPMLRVDVLKNRRFLVGTIIGMLVQGALLAAGILMPIYIQSLHGLSATVSGLVLMPGAILMGVMNPIAGKWFDRHGPRRMAIVGMTLLTLTTFAFALLNTETSIVYLTVVYTIRMFSMTLVNMPITTWGMNALDNKVMNHGTSVNNTLRQVAGSLGTAIIIAVSTQVQNIASPSFGAVEGTMLGINAAFLVCTVLCLVGLVMTIALVKDKPGEEAAVDEGNTRKSLLMAIMKTDVYSLHQDATVEEAMRLFVEKNISAAPIVDESGEPVGFISDGDILKRLSPRSNSFTDPIVLINRTVMDDEGYAEKLAKVMQMRASEIGVGNPICVSVHADLTNVCRVLAENHLKKVPVLEDGHIVGVINRSDITQYSMAAYLSEHPGRAVFCGDEPSGQMEAVMECDCEKKCAEERAERIAERPGATRPEGREG